MPRQYLIDLESNDNLDTVIKKANHNFKALTSSTNRRSQIQQAETENFIEGAFSTLSDDVADELAAERAARYDEDVRINDRIDSLVGGTGNVTGVKGSAEENFRVGDVEIDEEDIGLNILTSTEIDEIWALALATNGD